MGTSFCKRMWLVYVCAVSLGTSGVDVNFENQVKTFKRTHPPNTRNRSVSYFWVTLFNSPSSYSQIGSSTNSKNRWLLRWRGSCWSGCVLCRVSLGRRLPTIPFLSCVLFPYCTLARLRLTKQSDETDSYRIFIHHNYVSQMHCFQKLSSSLIIVSHLIVDI